MILRPEPAPRPPFALEALARLPLAEAFYHVWAYLADDAVLAELFARHRGRCYEDQLTFAELVEVLADAITRYHGSGNQAIGQALGRQRLSAKGRAVYDKLGRVPLPLSEALLSGLTARLRELAPPGLYRRELPLSLAGLAVIITDGKKVKKAAKRLLQARGRPGKLYGGKVLVAYLPADGLACAMAADADGEANDIRLVPRLLPLARAAVAGPRLWVADSQFCDLDQAARFREGDDHFLVRFTQRNSFTPDPARPPQAGTDAAGRPYTQQWGWMGAARDPRRCYVRLITLERPGAPAVVLVSDLTDEGAYPAADLLAVYLLRWQIENVFQQITEVFALDHLIGCTPQATVLQASLCLMIYNALQVLRGYAAAAARPAPVRAEVLSAEKIFDDLHEELVGLHRVLHDDELRASLPKAPPAPQVRARLAELLARAWVPRWLKAVNNKPRPHQPKARQSGAHTSVHKVLQEARQKQDKPTPQCRC